MARGRWKKRRSTAPRKAWWLLALALLPLLIAVDWSAQHRDIGEWWRGETAKQSDAAAPSAAQDDAAGHAVIYPNLTAGSVADAESFMQLGPRGLPSASHSAGSGNGEASSSQPGQPGDSNSRYRGSRHGDGHGNGSSSAGLPPPGIAFLPPAGRGANPAPPSASTPDSSKPPGSVNEPGSGNTPGDSGTPGTPGAPGSTPGDSSPPATPTPLLPIVDATQPQNPPAQAGDPANTVPEPGTLWLLLAAAALLSMRKGFVRIARIRS